MSSTTSELPGYTLLRKIGSDKEIYTEKEMGIRVAQNLTSEGNFDYIELTTDKDVTITMESSESEDPDTASEESEITEEAEV